MSASSEEFLIYEEHSIYRREFLGRVSSSIDAHAQALAYSRRTRRPVSVRKTCEDLDPSTIVSSYLGGKCLQRRAPASDGTATHKGQ